MKILVGYDSVKKTVSDYGDRAGYLDTETGNLCLPESSRGYGDKTLPSETVAIARDVVAHVLQEHLNHVSEIEKRNEWESRFDAAYPTPGTWREDVRIAVRWWCAVKDAIIASKYNGPDSPNKRGASFERIASHEGVWIVDSDSERGSLRVLWTGEGPFGSMLKRCPDEISVFWSAEEAIKWLFEEKSI